MKIFQILFKTSFEKNYRSIKCHSSQNFSNNAERKVMRSKILHPLLVPPLSRGCVCVCVCARTHALSHSIMSNSCNPMDCSTPGSSVHGISQARILEQVAIFFSIGSSQLRLNLCLLHLLHWQEDSFNAKPPRKPLALDN